MKRLVQLSSIIFIFAIIMASCSDTSNEIKQETSDETIDVKVTTVHKQKVEQLYEYTAMVQANAVNHIAPTIPGRIDAIYVEVGDYVKKGDKLVQMDANNLNQAKAQLDNLEVTFKRIDGLYKSGGVSKSEWDAQHTALEVARTSYENLLTNTRLLSPIEGIVTMRNYDSGDIFSGNPILQVQQITPVKMLINISESQYPKVKKGMNAKIKLDVYENDEFNGKVNLIYPVIDPRTHTFSVELIIGNSKNKVRPGMYARATLNFGINESIVVSDVAIVKQQGAGDYYVFVHKDGKAIYRQVKLGRRLGDRYEILSGVEDGEEVITTGLHKLNDGKKVNIISKEDAVIEE